jgi:hypothetical protein
LYNNKRINVWQMQLLSLIEQLALLILVFALNYLLWLHYQERQEQSKKKDRKKPKRRKWQPKSPTHCLASQEGIHLTIKPIRRQAKPWREYKSPRGRKKKIKTQGHCGAWVYYHPARSHQSLLVRSDLSNHSF